MAVDHIRYDILAQEALRGLVRTVLVDAVKKGLPGEHHFFITFDTHADGVRISPRLREQYPEEMTVVLQHQFWDLKVGEDGFEVGLSFNGVAERLSVPFAAITMFRDPSVQFALQFEEIVETADETSSPAKSDKPSSKSRRPALHAPAQTKSSVPQVPAPAPTALSSVTAAEPTDDKPDKPSGGGEIVRLDRFRKNKK